MGDTGNGALAGLKILDLADERGIYGTKMLADMGADVVRPEPPQGDPLRQRGPFTGEDDQRRSLWHAFFATNRRFITLDLNHEVGLQHLDQLVQRAAIVVTTAGSFAVEEANLDAARTRDPELIVVDVSSFGPEGPWKDYLAPDLVAGALGGAVATTGDVDTPPLKSFGELNFMVSGVYTAIAALSALYARRHQGHGQRVGVSVHECIASCLEHVFMFYWYGERMMRDEGRVLPRRGATHWSNAYDVYPAKDGAIMVTPTPDFDAQLAWFIEEGVHEDLIDPRYAEPENMVERIEKTMAIFRKWVATKEVEPLFFEAQKRHSPYGWVLPLESLADNPQLDARQWYQTVNAEGQALKMTGAPYQFSATPWRLEPTEPPQASTEQLIKDIGWSKSS